MKVVSISDRLDLKRLDNIIDILDGMYQELETCYESLECMEEATQNIELEYRKLLDSYKGPALSALYYEYALTEEETVVE